MYAIIVRSVFSICSAGGLFLVLSFNRHLFTLSVPVLFGLSSFASYFVIQYKTNICANTIGLLMSSNAEEIMSLAAIDLAAWVAFHAVIGIILVMIVTKKRGRMPVAGNAALLLACSVLGFYSNQREPIRFPSAYILPYSFAAEVMKYRENLEQMRCIIKKKRDFPVADFRAVPAEMTAVLIVGESSRADHYHINGYPRNTSPELERAGAITFPGARSLHAQTNRSIPAIFCRADPTDGGPAEMSLVSAFNRAGFETIWISAQGYAGKHDLIASSIADEAGTVRFVSASGDTDFTSCNDGLLLAQLDTMLARASRKKLIVLHTIGSHWRYDIHYPENFRMFRPVCPRGFNPLFIPHEALVNSYDNSILYTDYIIGQVIERVKERTSLVLYVSDHGESLGEDGVYLHGSPIFRDEQHHTAMFAWASRRYIAAYGDRYRSLLANNTRPFTHGVLFHSILDGAGVSSVNINLSKSLFRQFFRDERHNCSTIARSR